MAHDAGHPEHRPRLGRGLAALLGPAQESFGSTGSELTPRTVPIEFLRPNPRNPRKRMDEAELDELTELDSRERRYPTHFS